MKFLVLLLVLCSSEALAQAADPACEWSLCGADAGVSAPASSSTGGYLPKCIGDDRFFCEGECRDVFDAQHHPCVEDCLRRRCVQPQREEASSRSESDRGCLELESSSCESACLHAVSSERLRCRRSCLSARCPNASRYDMASESADPGSLHCRRCKQENERTCERRCRHTSGSRGSWQSSVTGYACEELCLSSACGAKCALPAGL